MSRKRVKDIIYKYLHKIHIYGGLYCAAYLIFMGTTGLLFSHNQLIPKSFSSTSHFYPVRLDEHLSNDSLIAAVSQELDIFGYKPYWEQWSDSTGLFHFQITNPAAIYDIDLNPGRDTVFVKETRKKVLNVMIGMHGSSTGEPAVWITTLWHYYAESAVMTAILVLSISIYFWFRRSVRRHGEWILISGAALFSISYTLFIWLVG